MEDFPTEDKEAEEEASFENIVQGCIDSISNMSPDLTNLPQPSVVETLEDEAPLLEKQNLSDGMYEIFYHYIIIIMYFIFRHRQRRLHPHHRQHVGSHLRTAAKSRASRPTSPRIERSDSRAANIQNV